MSSEPQSARVVVIGAGIVGNALVYHLARLGWRDIVQLDKGPLPNPGGSTGHASNFIFPVDHGKEMTEFTRESQRQYKELGVHTECGGIEVARTEERMQELRRRMAASKSWLIPSELLTPEQIKEKVPYVNTEILLGGFYTPSVGVVDSLQAGTLFRQKAQELGALQVIQNSEVRGLDVEEGRIRRVHHDRGVIEAEHVVICCGVWAPRIAKMAGTTLPLVPTVHQMIEVGPVPHFAETSGEISFPIVRDMDTFMYERQHGGSLEIGSYAHRAILIDPDDIPAIGETPLSPTELPFTQEDFDPQMEDALELIPEILEDESVGVKYAINGLISLTPDGMPLIGELPDVKGLWTASAIWIKEAPGAAKTLAEWMTDGNPHIDPHGSDVARFYPHQRTKAHVWQRADEAFIKTYGIIHPAEQWSGGRGTRVSPFHPCTEALGAVYYEAMGWERPHWFASNEPLVAKYGVEQREAEWDARWWSPIQNAEHLQMRETAGLVDLSAFAIFDVTGPSALAVCQQVAVRQMDVAIGRVVYTPLLGPGGGFKSDLTIMRLAHDRFRVVSGSAHGMADLKWFRDHCPADGSAQVTDLTSAWVTLGIWGPKARDIVQSLTAADMSHAGFKFGTCRTIELGDLEVLASRISYVGDLGWELYVPTENGRHLYEVVWAKAKEHGAIPVGAGVYVGSGRLEKGYRAYGAELELEYDPVEAGMAPVSLKAEDFVGKAALAAAMASEPAATMCTLTMDSQASAAGITRYPLGREPILTPDGGAIVDAKGRGSYVTSAGSAPSIGEYVLMAYLPPQHAVVGTKLAVEYMDERYPVTVAIAGSTPIFDPENLRIRS